MSGVTARASRSGGRILVDTLRIHGVTRVFCVPGESYLDVLDALYDTPEIDVVVAKHEGAAANMAEADGKLTSHRGVIVSAFSARLKKPNIWAMGL